jgi:hypothetical protein
LKGGFKKLLFSVLVFPALVCAGEDETALPDFSNISPKVAQQLHQQWWARKKKPSIPIFRSLKQVVTGPVARRVFNTGKGLTQIARLKMKKGASSLMDGVVSLNTLNDVANNAVSLVTVAAVGPKWRESKRIRICTTSNLAYDSDNFGEQAAGAFLPGVHVQIMIDKFRGVDAGMFADSDPKQWEKPSMTCQPAFLPSDMSESLAIEKVICFGDRYGDNADYSFTRNNCGTFAQDMIMRSGLIFPYVPNAGIGTMIHRENEQDRKWKDEAQAYCDAHIDRIREIILALEKGETLTSDQRDHLKGHRLMSDDLYLQLQVSSARGKNSENTIPQSPYLSSNPMLKKPVKKWPKDVRHIFEELDEDSYQVLSQRLPSNSPTMSVIQQVAQIAGLPIVRDQFASK